MPFVPVPKDLTRIKSKPIFGLTVRQLVCFGGGALVGVPTYIFTKGSIGNDAAVLLMIGLMLPFFLFGIYEKDGQPLERILKNFISAQFIRPAYRPYQTENFYAALERQNQLEKEASKLVQKPAKKAGANPSSRAAPAPGRKSGLKKSHRSHAKRKAHRK